MNSTEIQLATQVALLVGRLVADVTSAILSSTNLSPGEKQAALDTLNIQLAQTAARVAAVKL